MNAKEIDLKRLRVAWTEHWEHCRLSQSECIHVLDLLEQTDRKLEQAKAALEFYADDSIQTREVVTQYKDSPPWTGFVKETGDDRRKSDKGRIARAALAEIEK